MIEHARTYIYGMDKYSGCNKVESTVTAVERQKNERVKRSHGPFFARLGVAAIAVGFILAVHFLPFGIMKEVKGVMRDVFCYDVFGRNDFGSSVFFD